MINNQTLAATALMNDLPLWSAPLGLKLIDTVRFKPNAKLLDVGCGLGFPAIELAMRFGEAATIFAVDPWVHGLEFAKYKAENFGITNIKFLKQYAENLSFSNAYFDTIVSNNGLNNVQNLPMALLECARVAKPGGQLVFAQYTNAIFHEFYYLLEETLLQLHCYDAIKKCQVFRNDEKKTVKFLTKTLNLSGFELLSCEEHVHTLHFANGESFLHHHFIAQNFFPVWKTWIDIMELRVFETLAAMLNDHAEKKGVFSVSIPFLILNSVKR